MVQYIPIPPPSPRTLLPPLLACLPTSLVSPCPPPALYPLLSPTLRQRVRYLTTPTTSSTTNSSSSSVDSWLPLLCRHIAPAQRLIDIITESDAFELHPVSGEIDVEELDPLQYRRLDEETLQCKVGVPRLGLSMLYLWCQGDAEGGGSGWRVCDVRPLDDGDDMGDGMRWCATIGDADDAARASAKAGDVRQNGKLPTIENGERPHTEGAIPTIAGAVDNEDDDDGDDDYWAQYDNTPGRTPALTPGANRSPLLNQTRRARSTSEVDYYAQYAQVQPEMDGDDPSEDREAVGKSTLNGDGLLSAAFPRRGEEAPTALGIQGHAINGEPHGFGNGSNTASYASDLADRSNGLSHPTVAATSAPSIQRLQDSAEVQCIAEIAIKQHVGANMKSLFRLCQSTGMDRAEFDEMIKEELEGLKIMDQA